MNKDATNEFLKKENKRNHLVISTLTVGKTAMVAGVFSTLDKLKEETEINSKDDFSTNEKRHMNWSLVSFGSLYDVLMLFPKEEINNCFLRYVIEHNSMEGPAKETGVRGTDTTEKAQDSSRLANAAQQRTDGIRQTPDKGDPETL